MDFYGVKTYFERVYTPKCR